MTDKGEGWVQKCITCSHSYKKKDDAWYVVAELRRILLLDGVTVKEVTAKNSDDAAYNQLYEDYIEAMRKLCKLQEKEVERLK